MNWNGEKAATFLRVSSKRQEDGNSHEIQENHVKQYCNDIDLNLSRIFRIVESAKRAQTRKKYAAAREQALAEGIQHFVFYMYDRETRNLTDNEANEQLVRDGKLIIHYVSDNKVLHKGSADADFFLRDIQAATNKNFCRNLSTKVIDSQRVKAESGWFPGNIPPLGYVHQKLRDEFGKELKRGTIIVKDPDSKIVRQVQREFELRAQRMPFALIRRQIIAEGFMPPSEISKYYTSGIEKRLKNKFYRGCFVLRGVEYKGKHEIFIPKHIIAAVDRTFGKKNVYRKNVSADNGVFGFGWLKCGNPNCGCHVVYDPKEKAIKKTGERKTFHYYHCTNGKGVHSSLKGLSINEGSIWESLGSSIDEMTIPQSWADGITDALNKTHDKVRAARKQEIEGYKSALLGLHSREDDAYLDFKKGILDELGYKRQIERIRQEQLTLTELLEKSNNDIDDAYLETSKSILELATQLRSLWNDRTPQERLMLIDKVLSNPVLDGKTLRYDYKKPFGVLAKMRRDGIWRPRRDLNPCYRRERAMSWTGLDDGDI